MGDHGKVYVECHPQLKTLLGSVPGVARAYGRGEKLPRFDCVAPLMSLPMLLGTQVDTIPALMPYVKPDAALVRQWQARTPTAPGLRRIGLCWQGDPRHKNDRNRSIPLKSFAALVDRNDLACFSLQKLHGSEQIAEAGLGDKIIDHTAMMRDDDFSDAAALIMTLDLVITIDSAIAHLAGALGKPVWLMLPYASEWRWLYNRTDSPWYPSARLFRQPQRGDWNEVLTSISQALNQGT
jgi:ADP-heptose:LPS heptosyltransferase